MAASPPQIVLTAVECLIWAHQDGVRERRHASFTQNRVTCADRPRADRHRPAIRRLCFSITLWPAAPFVMLKHNLRPVTPDRAGQ
jgi:hypothetical protein